MALSWSIAKNKNEFLPKIKQPPRHRSYSLVARSHIV